MCRLADRTARLTLLFNPGDRVTTGDSELVAGWLDFAPSPSNQLRVSRRDGFTRAEEKAQEGGLVRKAAHSHSCGEVGLKSRTLCKSDFA